MTAADLLSEFLLREIEIPLGDELQETSPLAIVKLICDLESEIQMSGMVDALGNLGGQMPATIRALVAIGCEKEAIRLEKILEVAARAGMTYEAIQEERAKLDLYAVSSFEETHGDKWSKAADEIEKAADRINWDRVLTAVEKYVGQHSATFRDALGRS